MTARSRQRRAVGPGKCPAVHKQASANEPITTLREAREQLNREWPGNAATLQVWLAYYRRAVDLYANVAETDPDHHHEALYWAARAAENVKDLSVQINGT
jgi:hypothetical protein